MVCIKTRWATALATCCVVSFLSFNAAVCAEDSGDPKTVTAPKTYLPNSKSNPLAQGRRGQVFGGIERPTANDQLAKRVLWRDENTRPRI
jgi:hypothetical protein